MNNEELENQANAKLLRLKAEEQLKLKQDITVYSEVNHNVKKLLHELQVHQIELEMQNEELREAYSATEIALKKYTMLYDLAPMGYFTLEQNGNITELNFTGAEILGDRRFSLVNSNFKLFVSDASKGAFNSFLSRVFTSNYKETCEVQLGYIDKPSKSVYMEGVVIGDDRNCLLSVVDISGIKTKC